MRGPPCLAGLPVALCAPQPARTLLFFGFGLVPELCFWRFIVCHSVQASLFQGELNPSVPKKKGGKKTLWEWKWEWESSKVTFSVFPSFWSHWVSDKLETGSISPTVRSALFFVFFLNASEDRYKPEEDVSWLQYYLRGHSFLRPYLSVSNGPSVIPARYQPWTGR